MRTLPWDTTPHLPWQVFTSPLDQWAVQPSFLIGEYVIIACAVIAFIHAKRCGPGHLLIALAALIAGTCNDLIFMALPMVDTFWQGQASIMLTVRVPLYIPCIYVVFMYWPTVAARRLGLGRWQTAAITGLLACIFYAPYDIVGAKFLWWTWHDTDATIAARLFGVPVSSSLWVLTFSGAFALLVDIALRNREITRGVFLKGVALVAGLPTITMLAQMTVLQSLEGGTPGYVSFALGVAIYAAVALFVRTPGSVGALGVDWLGRCAATAYLVMLMVNIVVFAPETHVSTGVHQVPGACDAENTDITGVTRKTFLCLSEFDEDFTFECTTPPAQGAEWYTICGKAHQNYAAHVAAVTAFSLFGILVFVMLFGARQARLT